MYTTTNHQNKQLPNNTNATTLSPTSFQMRLRRTTAIHAYVSVPDEMKKKVSARAEVAGNGAARSKNRWG
jgi:hypothetical protein